MPATESCPAIYILAILHQNQFTKCIYAQHKTGGITKQKNAEYIKCSEGQYLHGTFTEGQRSKKSKGGFTTQSLAKLLHCKT